MDRQLAKKALIKPHVDQTPTTPCTRTVVVRHRLRAVAEGHCHPHPPALAGRHHPHSRVALSLFTIYWMGAMLPIFGHFAHGQVSSVAEVIAPVAPMMVQVICAPPSTVWAIALLTLWPCDNVMETWEYRRDDND